MKSIFFVIFISTLFNAGYKEVRLAGAATEQEKSTGQSKSSPLIITGSKIQSKDAPVALLISGDGGWYGFEQAIADKLAQVGIPTIGLDSRKYFWKRRSPEEVSDFVAIELGRYAKEWGRKKFLFIGYSFGAEIVPFIINRLPAEIRAEVVHMVLLSPETTTDFEVHISNMLGLGSKRDVYKVTDEIRQALSIPILIIYGEGEKPQIPELLSGTPVKIIKIPGDHHYKSNESLIIQKMKDNNAL